MKKLVVFAAACLMALSAAFAADEAGNAPDGQYGLAFGRSTAAEILEGAYQQIMWYEARELDVPEGLYEFYFKYEKLVHPELYETRHQGSVVLDEFADTCPGTIIQIPDEDDYTVISYGQTNNAQNDCTYPDCRWGRDVVVQVKLEGSGSLTITTTGSNFDTYLSVFEDECFTGDTDLYNSNNNNPGLCNGQRLASGIYDCFSAGTYWIVIDGAGAAARGSYALTIEFEDFCD